METDGHRIIVNENIDVKAGRAEGERPRVLTMCDAMHRMGKIPLEGWQAGEAVRERIMALVPPSEGVSSYGLSPGRADPATKAARKGRALTGLEVNWRAGHAEPGKFPNRTNLRDAADLVFAMIGMPNKEGLKVFDPVRATFLIQSVTGNGVTLTEIGATLTAYTGEKQRMAAGAAILMEMYYRGAVYLGLVKGTEWDEKLRWVPA